MDILSVVTDPRTVALLLVLATLALGAARIGVALFKKRAARTPDKRDDEIAEVVEDLVDAADDIVKQAKGKK